MFSREDRDLNIARIGYVATEVARALAVSPVRADRPLCGGPGGGSLDGG